MKIIKDGKPFTTFQVARICKVFHTTVINWVNKGKLKAHLTPGGHRRINLEDLLDFMQRFSMPIPHDLTQTTKKVLIVEDDPAVQRMIARALQGFADLEIQSCSGGLEALIEIGKSAPELLILDIRIPQVDGFAVCRLLRSNEQTRPIKILAISGETITTEEKRFLRSGADAFFQKPLSIAELKETIAELLDLELAA